MRLTRWNFAAVTIAFILAGGLIAGVWSLLLPKVYVSTAVVRADVAGPENEAVLALMRAQQAALSRHSLGEIIRRRDLYREERARLPLEDVIVEMRRGLRIATRDHNSGRLTLGVEFQYPEPALAQGTVGDVVAALQSGMSAAGRVEVLSAASLARAPGESNRGRLIAFGLLLGLFAGVAAGVIHVMVRNRRRWKLRRIAVFAAAGMLAGAGISLAIPDEYVSTAVIRSGGRMDEALLRQVLSDAVLTRVIRDAGLYRGQTAVEALQRMRTKDVRIQPAQAPVIAFVISFRSHDRALTQRVTRDLVSACVDAGMTTGAGFEVLDPASDPAVPSYPNRPGIAGTGLLAGALLGVGAARLRRPAVATHEAL